MKDLLALALTTRVLSDFIIPVHLQPRLIRCLTNTSTLWSNLKKRPDLCWKVREIELYEGVDAADLHLPRGPYIPQPLLEMDAGPAVLWPTTAAVWDDPNAVGRQIHIFTVTNMPPPPDQHAHFNEESMLAFHRTLPLLTNLRRFSLSSHSIDAGLLETILAALVSSSHGLRELAITWTTHHPISLDPFAPLWGLSNLSSFEFSVWHPNAETTYPDQLTDMLLERCPRLTKLFLDIPPGIIVDKIWETANWPQLRHLSITLLVTDNIFHDFLKRHPQIEYLESSRFSVDLDTLSNLRALNLCSFPSTLTEKARDVLERLEHISLIEPPFGCIELASSLRTLVVGLPRNWYQRGTAFPSKLERLCIKRYGLAYGSESQIKEVKVHIGGILEAITGSNLKSLTHFCVAVPPEWFPQIQTRNFLGLLARTVPSLKYFGLARSYQMREGWIRIVRDENGIYMGHELDNTVEEVQRWAFLS